MPQAYMQTQPSHLLVRQFPQANAQRQRFQGPVFQMPGQLQISNPGGGHGGGGHGGGGHGGGGRQNWTPRNAQIVGQGGWGGGWNRGWRGWGWGGWGGWGGTYATVYPACYASPYPPYYVCTNPYAGWGYPFYANYANSPWGGNPWLYG